MRASTSWNRRSALATASAFEAPKLGIGMIFSAALRPFLQRRPNALDLLEIEPQTLWLADHAFEGPFFEFTPLGNKAVYSIYEIAVQSPTTSFIVPAFIWILVSFRKSDFEGWQEQGKNGDKKNRRQKTSSGSAAGLARSNSSGQRH